jgi:hypothetical protein
MTGTNYTFIDFVKYLTRKYCTRCVSKYNKKIVVASTLQSPLVDCAALKKAPLCRRIVVPSPRYICRSSSSVANKDSNRPLVIQ